MSDGKLAESQTSTGGVPNLPLKTFRLCVKQSKFQAVRTAPKQSPFPSLVPAQQWDLHIKMATQGQVKIKTGNRQEAREFLTNAAR